MFLVFTNAESYFKTPSALSLRDYVREIQNSSIGSGIADTHVIAVDNACFGYKRDLLREAVLGLIWKAAVFSNEGAIYTSDLHKDIQKRTKEALERLERERSQLKNTIEEEITKVLSSMSMDCLAQTIGTSDFKDIQEKILKVGLPHVSGLESRDYDDFVTKTIDARIREVGKETLTQRLIQMIEEEIKDSRADTKGLLEKNKVELEAAGVDEAQCLVNGIIVERILELKRNEDQQINWSNIRKFIKEHIDLHDKEDEILEVMRNEREEWKEPETRQLVLECLNSHEIKTLIRQHKEEKANRLSQCKLEKK